MKMSNLIGESVTKNNRIYLDNVHRIRRQLNKFSEFRFLSRSFNRLGESKREKVDVKCSAQPFFAQQKTNRKIKLNKFACIRFTIFTIETDKHWLDMQFKYVLKQLLVTFSFLSSQLFCVLSFFQDAKKL